MTSFPDEVKNMKRILCITITLLMLFVSTAAVQAADSYLELNGFSFTIDGGTAVIHEYSGDSADVVIPETLLSAKVVKIDNYAFYGNKKLKSVSFDEAEHLKSIGDSAFCGCTSLEEVSLPAGVELSFGAFQKCTSLKILAIADGIKKIPAQSFYGCTSLREANVPKTVTEISASAFKNDPNLTLGVYNGTSAQTFAEENDIPYVILDEVLLGDADGDGEISISDVTGIQKFLAELEQLDALRRKAADVTRDGEIDVTDATTLQMYIAGIYSVNSN